MSTKELTRRAQPKVVAPALDPARRRLFDPFGFLQTEIDSVFDSINGDFTAGTISRPFWPSMDVHEDEAQFQVIVELPGMTEADIDISFRDGALVLRGEKRADREESSGSCRLFERSYGAFERSLRLPAGTEASKIKANLANGLLRISVPKAAGSNGQKIPISRS